MRILIVDDDAFAAEMTEAVLESAGHTAVIVENGVDAVETLARDPGFDIVVSDMNMPLICGLELFEALRADGCLIPFILLSGDDPEELRQREPRLDACLIKDSDLVNTLNHAVASVLAACHRGGQDE